MASGDGGSPSEAVNSLASTAMYSSPNAVVRVAAAAAATTPPATEPTPGTNFNRLETTARPRTVAPAGPAIAATSVLKNALESSIPKVAEMPASMPT